MQGQMCALQRSGPPVVVALFLAIAMFVPNSIAYSDFSDEGTSAAEDLDSYAVASQLMNSYVVENKGQVGSDVMFYIDGNPAVSFREDGVMFVLREEIDTDVLSSSVTSTQTGFKNPFLRRDGSVRILSYVLRFIGSNRVSPDGINRQSMISNFLIGNNPSAWVIDVPNFEGVVYRDLYDGIDLVFRPGDDGLKYEFMVAPGSRPENIRMTYDGVRSVIVDDEGVAIRTDFGFVRDTIPYSYQGANEEVLCDFVGLDAFSYGFACAGWDRSKPLVIDPLIYSTYLGGSGGDRGYSVKVDSNRNAYVVGHTASINFPTTPGVYDSTLGGTGDAFVTKFDSSGTSLVYSTYIGGSSSDVGLSIAIDSSSNVIISGETLSTDFPTTIGAYDRTHNGNTDAFFAKLSAAGDSLLFSTFIGGSENEMWPSITIDTAGDVYACGSTDSSNFPTTPGAYDRSFNGGTYDAFSLKLTATGTALAYSTFLGGSDMDLGYFISLDSGGNAYITGETWSTDLPTTPTTISPTFNGFADAFVTKIDPTGASLDYSTYLGSSGYDIGLSIAVDSSGNAYVSGFTGSTNFPVTPGAYDTTMNSPSFGDSFVTKLDSSASNLVYSTYLGGSGTEHANAITIDPTGNVYITGGTNSTDFPMTPDAIDPTYGGGGDAFVSELNASGDALIYSTYLGGAGQDDWLPFIALDSLDDVYVAGITKSTNYPLTANAYDSTLGGPSDAFLTKIRIAANNKPEPPFPLCIDGLCSDNIDARLYHITTLNNYLLEWNHNDSDLDAQLQADVAISTMPNRVGVVWTMTTIGTNESILYNGPSLQRCTDYFFSAITRDILEWGDMAEMRFHTNCPPGIPIHTAPPDGAILVRGPKIVWWSHSSDNDLGDLINYSWQVSIDWPPVTIVASGTTSSNYSDVFMTSANMRYFWQVRASDGWDSSQWTTPWMIVSVEDPKAPVVDQLTIESHGTGDAYLSHVTERTSPVLAWNFTDSNGDLQDQYKVIMYFETNGTEVWNRSGFGDVRQVTYAGPPLVNNTDYCFSVNASDDSFFMLWSGWSTPLCFHINTPPPVPSTPVNPPHGTYVYPGVVRINWTSGIDAEGDNVSFEYCVDVSTPPSACSVANGTTGDNASNPFVVNQLITHFWTVRAYDGHEFSLWSEIWNFSVQPPPNTPPAIQVNSPPNLEQGTSYTITWTMADNETSTAQLTVYVNYTLGAIAYPIAGPLIGNLSYLWMVPMIESQDIRINVTVIDEGGLRGWDDSEPFEIFAPYVDQPPTISLSTPTRLATGTVYDITWTMDDVETPSAQLVVYLNYSYGGGSQPVAGPLVGSTMYAWTVPTIERTDVRLNATILDSLGQRNWSETPEFEIFRPNTPPWISLSQPPSRVQQGSNFTVQWTMGDGETSPTQLVVYLNYSYNGSVYTIIGPRVGSTSYVWRVPNIVATDVTINATVIDAGGLRNWSETLEFEVYLEPPPEEPPEDREVEFPWILIAIAIATVSIIFILIIWRRRKKKSKKEKVSRDSSEVSSAESEDEPEAPTQ